MTADAEFVAHALDLFAPLGPLHTGRLFSGTSLYLDDAMFAVIFGNRVFMKTDPALAKRYASADSEPFSYETKAGTRKIKGLMSLPDSALDDPDEALAWARCSLEPAKTAAKARKNNPRKERK